MDLYSQSGMPRCPDIDTVGIPRGYFFDRLVESNFGRQPAAILKLDGSNAR